MVEYVGGPFDGGRAYYRPMEFPVAGEVRRLVGLEASCQQVHEYRMEVRELALHGQPVGHERRMVYVGSLKGTV
jgi:hypothetical protein